MRVCECECECECVCPQVWYVKKMSLVFYSTSLTFDQMDSRSSPPSPAASSPSLTQSVSNSSSSPPQPTTPPRQPRPRYPDLGRVPLHRRGTSKTYERLEDLLREAGYKETRIFTPESDKPRHPLNHTRDGDEDQGTDQSKKQGVGAAVVGFLTGLVTGGRNNNVTTASDSRHQVLDLGSQSDDSNSSTSPLANKQQRRDNGSLRSTSSKLQTPLITHRLSYTPKAYHRQNLYPYYENQSRPSSRPTTPSPFQYPTSSPQHRRQLSVAQLQLQHKASHSSIHSTAAVPVRQGSRGQIRATGDKVIQHPRPSRAGTYLRHMVSTPSIPSEHLSRPNSTPAACQHFQRNSHIGNSLSDIEAGVTTTKSPLPRNWLDNVARAIIFGVAATGVTTSTTTSSSNTSYFLSHHHQRTLRATRSSLSQTTIARNNARRSGLSDQTNVISAGPSLECLVPPALFTRLEKGRAPSSQGLLKAQVVCRSAPASRASSAVRGQNAGGGHRGTRQPSKRHLKDGNGRVGTEDNTRGRQQFTAAHSKVTDKFKPKNKKSQKADAGKPRVPTLARTRIEGDGWHTLHPRATTTTPQTHPIPYSSSDTEHTTPSLYRRHATPKSGYSSGYVSATNSYFPDSSTSESVHDFSTDHDADDGDDDDDDDDDDEGELTLARMLVPPKRQHSIRSLRQHLHLHFASSPTPFHTTTTSSRSRSDAATIMTLKNHNKLRPSLSRRPAYHSSSTATLRSNSALGGDGGGVDGTDVGRRVTSFSVARSRLLNLVVSTGSEKDLTTTPTKTPTTAVGVNVTRRTAAAAGGGRGGEWEREWRKGQYSSRKSNEDEDEVESLTWLNRDDDDDNVIVTIASNTTTPTTSATANSTSTSTTTGGTITKATGSQKSGKGKSRLGLPSWKSPTMMTTTSAASLAR